MAETSRGVGISARAVRRNLGREKKVDVLSTALHPD